MKFWRMTGLIAASPVDSILDKDNFKLEELLDEEETVQECRGRNNRLINFLRNKSQVEQLVRYIVEEAPEDADERQIYKFPFIACEIFICDVDIILNTLVEDEEMMDILFSFLKPGRPQNTLLAGYFSKVVICLVLRKTALLMIYAQNHQEILRQLVDLIGITSIMEVLIWLIGANENMCTNYEEMQWLKDSDVLEMIVDKFRSSDSPEVHANASEVLCAIIRNAPPGIASKICTSSFMGKLFSHALEGSRPKSVLVNALSVCISLLDPNRLVSASYNLFRSQLTQGSLVAANPDTIDGILESLGNLLNVLDVSSAAIFFPTTYGYLKPPLGKHRLKIVEFICVLLTIGSEAAERKLVQQGAVKQILNMFFEYPYNNFLHHTVENIIGLCLDSRNTLLIGHLLNDCDIVGKILEAEKQPLLSADCSKPTIATRGRPSPRLGNFGHIMRIANKLLKSANSNNLIHTHLQENEEWVAWHENVLLKRNAVDNLSRWVCGRPNALQDQLRFSDNEDLRDTDYDMVELANNFSEASSNEDITDSVEVVSSPSTNSNQFIYEDSAGNSHEVKDDEIENIIDSSISGQVSISNTNREEQENPILGRGHESLPNYDPKSHEDIEANTTGELEDSNLMNSEELLPNHEDIKASNEVEPEDLNLEDGDVHVPNYGLKSNEDLIINEAVEADIKEELRDSNMENFVELLQNSDLKSNDGHLIINERIEVKKEERNKQNEILQSPEIGNLIDDTSDESIKDTDTVVIEVSGDVKIVENTVE